MSAGLRCRHLLERAMAQAAAALFRVVGHRASLATGAALGSLAYRLSSARRREQSLVLLREVLDGSDERALERIAREASRSLFANLAELLWLRHAPAARIALLVEIDGASRRVLARARRSGRGILLVGIHFGRWELMFQGCALAGAPCAIVVQRLANPALDAFLNRIRTRFGNTVRYRGEGLAALGAVLEHGGILLLSMDHHQPAARGGIPVRFLGRPTELARGVGQLAAERSPVVLPVLPLPRADGRIRLAVGPALKIEPGPERHETAQRAAQACADVFDPVIRAHPERWMWGQKHLWGRYRSVGREEATP